jgi:hypothetical protein
VSDGHGSLASPFATAARALHMRINDDIVLIDILVMLINDSYERPARSSSRQSATGRCRRDDRRLVASLVDALLARGTTPLRPHPHPRSHVAVGIPDKGGGALGLSGTF